MQTKNATQAKRKDIATKDFPHITDAAYDRLGRGQIATIIHNNISGSELSNMSSGSPITSTSFRSFHTTDLTRQPSRHDSFFQQFPRVNTTTHTTEQSPDNAHDENLEQPLGKDNTLIFNVSP